MASDGVSIAEDTEMAECDGDKVVTMMDVLQEQQDFEEDANAVLGASDDKNCTYPKGYIKRQALYACLTCCTEAKVDPTKRAGVCLACSLTCHENHELIELYTKRNFRCDCGNPKFNSHPCQFTSDKTELNDDNIYNQNFSGLYCTCQRPYPDPESTIDEDMIQCIICEDWLHASHLEAVVPANDQYSEMVCKNCMEKNEFLHDYSMFAVTVESGDVDIITVNGDVKSADNTLHNGDSEKEKLVNGIEENKTEIGTTSVTVNGDVEMNGDKEKSTDDKAVDESVAAEIKQNELSTVESSEIKPEEKEKPNADDSKMDLDTESKTTKQEESPSVETIDTNEPAKTDAPAEQEQKEITENTSEKSDAAENTPIADPTKNNETSPEKTESTDEKPENADNTDEKRESTDTKPEKADETIKEETELQEQKSKQSKIEEDGDGDNAQENKTETSERTEQQLLDDLTALTADNPTSEEKTVSAAEEKPETAAEDKSVESMEQSEDLKVKEESAEETANESGDQSEEKPVVNNETATGNIEVPDTSQSEKNAKENTKEKTDSVMDAIDELLQTANDAKEKESAEETNESKSESTESKEATDNVKTKETDVEMSASENKLDNEVHEKKEDTADSNNKPSTNTDVEMSDTSTQNELVSESKINEPKTDLENKDVNDTEVKLENESIEEKPQVSDTANDCELKPSDDNDSTIKTETSKDKNEVHTATENAKEHKRKLSTDLTDDVSSKKAKLECVRPKDLKRVHKGATFWPSNFRHKLCTCGECLSMYKDLKVLFLTDLEDTVFAYESLGKENVAAGASQYEKGMQALSSLDRIHQINALTEYNKMRDKLLDFLKSFKDRKEVVKEEDIKAFFAGMKPRREPDGVYFCR